jgi:hypothetical protein
MKTPDPARRWWRSSRSSATTLAKRIRDALRYRARSQAMEPPPNRPLPAPDAMPSTRGLNFDDADPNLEFVCATGSVLPWRALAMVDWTPIPADALSSVDPAR